MFIPPLFLYWCPLHSLFVLCYLVFFFNDPATTEIYTLSLHDALPISHGEGFWATLSCEPKARTNSASTGSSRRSRGTSGKRAKNSSTVIGPGATHTRPPRSRERRICMPSPPRRDYTFRILSGATATGTWWH